MPKPKIDRDLRGALGRLKIYGEIGYPVMFDSYKDREKSRYWYLERITTNEWCIFEQLECEKRGLTE